MMPSALPQRRLACEIAQPQMDLVSGNQRGNQIAAAAMLTFADRQCDCEIAARMGRVAREIIVVAVQVAQQAAIDEGRERRRGFLTRADQRRLRNAPAIKRHAPHGAADVAVESPDTRSPTYRARAPCRPTPPSAGNSSNRTECTSAASASRRSGGRCAAADSCIAIQNAKRLEPPSTGITVPSHSSRAARRGRLPPRRSPPARRSGRSGFRRANIRARSPRSDSGV